MKRRTPHDQLLFGLSLPAKLSFRAASLQAAAFSFSDVIVPIPLAIVSFGRGKERASPFARESLLSITEVARH